MAQPGQTPVLPPANTYQPAITLSANDQALLNIGEITDGQRIGGVAAAFFVGLGLGQIVEGRWSDTGWIFTFGEIASVGLVVHGAAEALSTCGPGHGNCGGNNGWLLGGMLALCTFRVWEVIDAAVVPQRHNARLRALKVRMTAPVFAPYASSSATGDGAVAGLAARF